LISARVVLADFLGYPGKVVLNRSANAVLEVDDERSVRCVEHVPGVRLAVQQVLDGATVDDGSPQVAQRVDE
jgi:hypothetical protein